MSYRPKIKNNSSGALTDLALDAASIDGIPSSSIVTKVDSVSPSSGNVTLNAVRYSSQSLTDAQKTQARTNIGAGTSNLTIGTTSTTAAAGNHTHSIPVNNTTYSVAPSSATKNGFYYVTSSTSGLSGADANPLLQYHTSNNDFRILTTAYSDTWLQQIATDFRSNNIYFRRKENGTWKNWERIALASDIPTVNNATLTIQKNGTTVNTFTANASSNVTANITVPTKISDLTNDSNFLVNNADISMADYAGTFKSLTIGNTLIGQLAAQRNYSIVSDELEIPFRIGAQAPGKEVRLELDPNTGPQLYYINGRPGGKGLRIQSDVAVTSTSTTNTTYKISADTLYLNNNPFLHAGAQTLTDAQKTQARTNIGAQATLISGTNIKTINNQSILGSGNISISGGAGAYHHSTRIYQSGWADIQIHWWSSTESQALSGNNLQKIQALYDILDGIGVLKTCATGWFKYVNKCYQIINSYAKFEEDEESEYHYLVFDYIDANRNLTSITIDTYVNSTPYTITDIVI